MTTPAELGERALRRLGVAVVPVASRPALSVTVSVTAIAERALAGLGVPVAAAVRPSLSTIVSVTSIAERALQALGATVTLADRPAFTTTIPAATIATNALVELGVIASDETPSATDQALALAKVLEVHDALVAQAAVSWSSAAILQAAAEEYTKLTALVMASSFGKTVDPAQWPALEARVKRISLLSQSQSLAEARVAAIHDGLVGQAAASWQVNAIPQAASDDYVALAVQQMAPLFGAQAPGIEATSAIEARIKRIALIMQSQGLAEARVVAIHDELVGSANVSWASTAIPQAVSDDYVGLTMIKMAPTFEIKADPAGVPILEARVRHFSMVQRAPDLATAAVMSVHQDLAARGKVRWTVFDIPAHVEDPYIMLAAYQLAPEFEMKPNAVDAKIAEVSLSRYIGLPSSGERVAVDYF